MPFSLVLRSPAMIGIAYHDPDHENMRLYVAACFWRSPSLTLFTLAISAGMPLSSGEISAAHRRSVSAALYSCR